MMTSYKNVLGIEQGIILCNKIEEKKIEEIDQNEIKLIFTFIDEKGKLVSFSHYTVVFTWFIETYFK